MIEAESEGWRGIFGLSQCARVCGSFAAVRHKGDRHHIALREHVA
jgi:hypothetical protein